MKRFFYALFNFFLSSHLIGAGYSQSVEDRQENLRAHSHHQNISKADEDEDGSVLIHLHRGPQNGDGWHEAGWQGQSHRHRRHTPSTHQKVRGAALTSSAEGIVNPDACWDHQHQGEDHIVPHTEGRRTWHLGARLNFFKRVFYKVGFEALFAKYYQ